MITRRVNRQTGGDKLKSVLKFGTCHVTSHMRNDDLALCLWEHEVWGRISRKPLEIETWHQQTTNRKWPAANRMPDVTDDVKWPWKVKVVTPVSQTRLEIDAQFQWIHWNTNSKWDMTNRIAKVFIDSIQEVVYVKSFGTNMKNLDPCLEVVQGHVSHCVASNSPLNISETVSRGLVPKDHKYEIVYVSNGHVTDDVTWSQKVTLVTPICLKRNISKTSEDAI